MPVWLLHCCRKTLFTEGITAPKIHKESGLDVGLAGFPWLEYVLKKV